MKTILTCRHILRCCVKRRSCKKLYFYLLVIVYFAPWSRHFITGILPNCFFVPFKQYHHLKTHLKNVEVQPLMFFSIFLIWCCCQIFFWLPIAMFRAFQHNLTAVRRYLLYETTGNCNHFKDFHHLCEINISELSFQDD